MAKQKFINSVIVFMNIKSLLICYSFNKLKLVDTQIIKQNKILYN